MDEGVKRWLSYASVLTNIHDFDWVYVLQVEREQLCRLRNAIQTEHFYEGWERDVERINVMLTLMEWLINDDAKIMQWDENQLTYVQTKYVNTRNELRFRRREINYKEPKLKVLLDDLYLEKAWNLYNEIRKAFMRNWWW